MLGSTLNSLLSRESLSEEILKPIDGHERILSSNDVQDRKGSKPLLRGIEAIEIGVARSRMKSGGTLDRYLEKFAPP